MRRGSTPVNRFEQPLTKDKVQALSVTYVQDGAVVLKKKLNDVEVQDYKVVVNLDQEDTLKFDDTKQVKIQLKIKDIFNKMHISNVMYKTVGEVLDEDVM